MCRLKKAEFLDGQFLLCKISVPVYDNFSFMCLVTARI